MAIKYPDGIMNKIGLPHGRARPVCVLVGDPYWLELLKAECTSFEFFSNYKSIKTIELTLEGKSFLAISFGYGATNMSRVIVELGIFGIESIILLTDSASLLPGRAQQKDICITYAACRGERSSASEIAVDFPAVAHPHVVSALRKASKHYGVEPKLTRSFTHDIVYKPKIIRSHPLLEQVVQTDYELQDHHSSTFLVYTAHRNIKGAVLTCADIMATELDLDGNIIEDDSFRQARQMLMKITVKAAAMLT